jgi:hypothetical protein
MIKKLTLIVVFVVVGFYCQAQEVNTVQPTIMVIPFIKEGEDIRTKLENDFTSRVAITKVKEDFDQRGFTTIDFRTKLKALLKTSIFESAGNNQKSIKQRIIEQSGADIYVEVDFEFTKSPTGNNVRLNLTANDVFTGQALSNISCESGKKYVDDPARLTAKAVSTCIEPFLNTMQTKFTGIVEDGRSVVVNISFGPDSSRSMDDEIGEDELPLSDTIELWFEENAYKNYYHIQGTTSTKMILDDVRIPLKNPKTGKNYKATRFALEIYKFMKSLGLSCSKEVNGSTIYITIK